MSKLRKFLCNVLGWHEPSDCIDIHGINITSKCKYCGKKIMRDSQGNWFLRGFEMTKEQQSIAEERYQDLVEYFCGKDVAKCVLARKLEQQPSEDCVSRQAMLNAITEIDNNVNMDIYTNEVREIVKDLPPVTPTHGTCKDCKHNYKTGRNTFECSNGHRFALREPSTFYCADFEKRGDSDGSN